MKIAFDHQIFCSQSHGGISRYYVNLAEQLNLLRRAEVKIFAPWHINRLLDSLPDDLVGGVNVGRYQYKSRMLLRNLNRFESKRRIGNWRPQILHETYYAKKSVSPKGCPIVCTVYDMIHEIYPEKFSARDKTIECKRAAVKRADHVICISRNTQKDLIELLGVKENKTTVVYLGFQKFDYKYSAMEDSEIGNRFILYVGDRKGYKNFNRFIESFSISPQLCSDFEIIIFGGGALEKDEQALIKGLGLNVNRVRHLSGDDSVLGMLYSKASALVYPSMYEGFGLPPLEAMAHGCPVISSNSSSMPEVIGNAAEYFNPESLEEMRIAMENVLYSNERAVELGILSKKRLEHFSWNRCSESTMAVYERLVGGN